MVQFLNEEVLLESDSNIAKFTISCSLIFQNPNPALSVTVNQLQSFFPLALSLIMCVIKDGLFVPPLFFMTGPPKVSCLFVCDVSSLSSYPFLECSGYVMPKLLVFHVYAQPCAHDEDSKINFSQKILAPKVVVKPCVPSMCMMWRNF